MSLRKNIWIYWATALIALVAVVGVASAALAAGGGSTLQSLAVGAGAVAPVAGPATNDGFDALPHGLQGVSYSTLAMSGKVHPSKSTAPDQPSNWKNPFSPLLNIIWGPERDTSNPNSAGEPAAGMHPTNPLFALVSGNFSLDHTTDGGATWASIQPPNPHNSGDVTNAWLEGGPGPAGANALELSINQSGGYDYTCGRSTDFGVTWATDAACGPSVSTPYFDDREYIWVDHNPASPFYGRVYVTTALFDAAGSGSFNTVSNRWSSDNGTSWNPPSAAPLALVPNNEFATGVAHNEFPSIGISYNGTIGYAWRRGLCCGGSPTVGTNDRVMFARSADGGVSFPYSTTIVTVPLNQSIVFNSTSPLGVRWSDTPNIAADPGPTHNGTFYALWTQYRTPSTAASAAIYLSKTTDNGLTWSTPVIPYNNSNPNIFQGWGWVKVTQDGTVHVTYLGGTTSNTVVAQFYVQSTDGGATWSAPFQLSSTTFGPFAQTTDYEANDVSYGGGTGTILAAWAENRHFARLGTFVQGTPTPTVTGTPPTATPTRTSTSTLTATATPCSAQGVITNGGFETGTLPPWVVLGTNPPPVVSNALPHSGTYSALLGTVSGTEPTGDGSMYQTITVPASGGTLSYWWNGGTTDTIAFDWQDAYVTNTSGTILATIQHVCSTTTGWQNQTFNMAPYAGQTVRIEFLVHQDGFGDDTYMYVDDVALLTACNTPTVGNTATSTATNTATRTATAVSTTAASNTPVNTSTGTNTPLPTQTPGGASATAVPSNTNTPASTSTPSTPVATSTACPIQFIDVPNGSTFYPYIRCLACRGIVSGYADNTFRPNNNVTRGQLSKIVSNSAGFSETHTTQDFQDVPVGSNFYIWIERLYSRGIIGGYPCGGPFEPCGPGNLPYFRPNANATRGQITKIDANAAGYNDPPVGQQFQDVPPGSTFYTYTYQLVTRGIMSGYPCSGPGEPCVPPDNLPYFRPNNNATRGQTAKIVANTFFPNCQTPQAVKR